MKRKRILVSILALALALPTAELVFRLSSPALGIDDRAIANLRNFGAQKNNLFQPIPYLGFGLRGKENASEPPQPLGWNFSESKEPGAVRIACLGGSTTARGYPRSLRSTLRGKYGVNADVQNWGVPGWTSQETLVNYFVNVKNYDPDVVVIHHAVNDIPPRVWPGFRSDYSHYRQLWTPPSMGPLRRMLLAYSDIYAAMIVRNDNAGFRIGDFVNRPLGERVELTPETARTFAGNIRTIAEHARQRGGRAVLVTMPYSVSHAENSQSTHWVQGIEEHNGILRRIATEDQFLMVDFAAWAVAHAEEARTLFLPDDMVHMTSAGRRQRATLIAEALVESGYVQSD